MTSGCTAHKSRGTGGHASISWADLYKLCTSVTDAKVYKKVQALRADKSKWDGVMRRGGSNGHITSLADSATGPDSQSLGERASHFLPYHVVDFWIALALCHGLLVEEGHDEYTTRTYQVQRPDPPQTCPPKPFRGVVQCCRAVSRRDSGESIVTGKPLQMQSSWLWPLVQMLKS